MLPCLRWHPAELGMHSRALDVHSRGGEGVVNTIERNLVKAVARLAPWLAPFPSAYFVARSGMVHLSLPLPVAIIVAAIIETLGLSTVHSALWLADWNASKRKTDPQAPVVVALALGAVYLVATLGLVVFLEVWPGLATYAPALFPARGRSWAGSTWRSSANRNAASPLSKMEKDERKALRQAKRQADRQPTSPKTSNLTPKSSRFRRTRLVKARQSTVVQPSRSLGRFFGRTTLTTPAPVRPRPVEPSACRARPSTTILEELQACRASGTQ